MWFVGVTLRPVQLLRCAVRARPTAMDLSKIDVACPPLMAAQDFARIKVCAYYASFGKKHEQELKASKAGLVEFMFLSEKSDLNPLYRALIKQYKLAMNCAPKNIDNMAPIELLGRFNAPEPQLKEAPPQVSAVDWSNFALVGAVTEDMPVYSACTSEYVQTLPIKRKHDVLSHLEPISDHSV